MSHVTTGPAILRPHQPVAERVVLPGDPGRALRLAQQLLEAPKMVNHHRGLWGYSGLAADGRPLTVQSSGMGGPSAAAVVADLVVLGARRVVRAGTGLALPGEAEPGTLVIAEAALPGDGTSRALGAAGPMRADGALLAALHAAAGAGVRAGAVASTDLLPDHHATRAPVDAIAVDLTTAAVFAAAARRGAAAACVLAIAGVLGGGGALAADALEAAERALGALAAAALAEPPDA